MVACLRLPAYALVCSLLMGAPLSAQIASEPRVRLDVGGVKATAITGMPASEGCASDDADGRVIAIQIEKGAIAHFTFRKRDGSRSIINAPAAYEFKNPVAWERVRKALGDIVVIGHDVRMQMVRCGAAGRFLELTGIALRDPPVAQGAAGSPTPVQPTLMLAPPGPAPVNAPIALAAPSRWRVEKLSATQVNVTIRSNDRRSSLSVGCMRRDGALSYSADFFPPTTWSPVDFTGAIILDGTRTHWELLGSEDGYPISDGIIDNTHGFSEAARMALSQGQRLVIRGRSKGRGADVVFEIAGGIGSFTDFQKQCMSLRR